MILKRIFEDHKYKYSTIIFFRHVQIRWRRFIAVLVRDGAVARWSSLEKSNSRCNMIINI